MQTLDLDGPSLRNFCRFNRRAGRLCSDPYFRNAWIQYHDELTFQQRQDIDNILDKTVDGIVELANLEYGKDELDQIKKEIRENFRTKIGRDIKRFILKIMPSFFESSERVRRKYGGTNILDLPSYLSHLFDEIGLDNLFLEPLNLSMSDYSFTATDNILGEIGGAINDIFIINGVGYISSLFDFNRLVNAIPELKQYEDQWYFFMPKNRHSQIAYSGTYF